MEVIRQYDSIDDLQLYHFVECTNSSPKEIKEYRGIIKSGNKTVCKSFGFVEEYTNSELEKNGELKTKLDQILPSSNCFLSEEGTLLRCYFHNNQWFLSTHKKIDAFNSMWGNCKKSFGELFIDALDCLDLQVEVNDEKFDVFCSMLDRSFVYTFLLGSTEENRIVCDGFNSPTIFFTGKFDTKNNFSLSFINDTPFNSPEKLSFQNSKELLEYPVNFTKNQGILIYNEEDSVCIKIVSDTYHFYSQIRGNEPNIRIRYLQLLNNPEDVTILRMMYPEFEHIFDECDKILTKIVNKLVRTFRERYIDGKYVFTNPIEHFILVRLLKIYNRTNNFPSLKMFTDELNSEPYHRLNSLIEKEILVKIH
jgi:hypothetical protein